MNLPSQERTRWLAQCILPHEPELRRWLSRRSLVGLDIDDVVQESYAILVGLAAVDHIRNPRTYLFQIAKSVILQALRRSRIVSFSTLADAESLEVPCDAPGPEAVAAARQELDQIHRMIMALPPRCRDVFTLRKVHELSQREVAQRLGISENTVESHMGKAIRALSRAMGCRGADANSIRDGGKLQKPASIVCEDPVARNQG